MEEGVRHDDIHSCVRLAPDLLTPKMSLCPILTYIPPPPL